MESHVKNLAAVNRLFIVSKMPSCVSLWQHFVADGNAMKLAKVNFNKNAF